MNRLAPMKSTRPLSTTVLLLLFAAFTLGSNSLAAADTNAWQSLLQEEEVFFKSPPPDGLSQTNFDRFLTEGCRKALVLADKFEKVYRQDPAGPRAEKAWDEWMELLNISASRDTNGLARLRQVETEFLQDPNLSIERRIDIRCNQFARAGDAQEWERQVRQAKVEIQEARKKAGLSTNSVFRVFPFEQQLLAIAEHSDPENARRLIEEVLRDGDKFSHEEASQLKQQVDRVGQKLDLTFRALNGEAIDLTNYSGKVVLVDFWATWCPPCVGGLPAVKAAWEKFHARGLEVIGFSYDFEKPKLEQFLQRNNLGWPQYFHDEGRDSPLAVKLGQPGPPAYWLVDQTGRLVDLNGSADLELKIERLLEGKPVYPDKGRKEDAKP